MSLRQQFTDEMKKAMVAKDALRLKTIRLIQAALKDKDIAARGTGNKDGLGQDDIIKLLQTMVKGRRDAILLYEQGGRKDLADLEQQEIAIIKEFLPQGLEGADLEKAIMEAKNATGASSIKDMGKVMNFLKEKHPGQIDASLASGLVKKILS